MELGSQGKKKRKKEEVPIILPRKIFPKWYKRDAYQSFLTI
jgi:hypothetical protein